MKEGTQKTTQRRPFRRGAASAFADEIRADGRFGFSLTELVAKVGLDPVTARAQLARLEFVKPIYARADFYLIVRPEHRRVGAPPVEWWIDDFFKATKQSYYVGLLSAAALHGSSPQAIQVTQIVVEERRRPIRVGHLRLKFTLKKNASNTPVATPRGAMVPFKVSTPEATFLDLITYERKVGGMPRVFDVIAGLALTPRGLDEALAQPLDALLLQRAGFLLEHLGKPQLAAKVTHRLEGVRLQPAPLRMSSDRQAPKIGANPWKVIGTWGDRAGS